MIIKIIFILLTLFVMSGCIEVEKEDVTAYIIMIIVNSNDYEVEGKRSTDIIKLYREEYSRIIEKDKIQVILSVDNDIKYGRVKKSIDTLKKYGVKSVGFANRN